MSSSSPDHQAGELSSSATKPTKPTQSERAQEQGQHGHDSRTRVIEKAEQILRLARGPEDHILHLAWAAADTANLAILVRFQIPQNIPLKKTISITDLSTATNLPADILRRTLRYAMLNDLFTEPAPDHFAHTPASAYLATRPHVADVVNIAARELMQITLHLSDGLELQQQQRRKGEKVAEDAAFKVTYPEFKDSNVFEFIGGDAELSERYHRYLAGRVKTERWHVRHLRGPPREKSADACGNAKQLGGSSAHTIVAIAPVCPPTTTFVVQDINLIALDQGRESIAAASAHGMVNGQHQATTKISPDLEQRTTFLPHDFFTPNPTPNADVYILRHILHGWSDADVLRILQNLVPALKRGAKVLVGEGLIPAEGSPAGGEGQVKRDGGQEKMVRMEDMFMLAVHGARERTAEDFARLFKQADPAFELIGVTGGQNGAFQSLIEFEYCSNAQSSLKE
ncbi:putative O-methyltransferase [Teratosphaeria destructans]|uniref:O-methyltransferase n=1 Tax=Teratosphaeria destructans TaxID=418781 RepID=A0A9W7VYC1_9PEZI|nr:putative O-methyltransferase [Teratosphaeria destructans]